MGAGAGVVDFLMPVIEEAELVAAHHPLAVPLGFVVVFALGWSAPLAWAAATRFRIAALRIGGVAVVGLMLVALAPAISASSTVPSCTFSQQCATSQQVHEECSQRHADWDKWQRCVERRTYG